MKTLNEIFIQRINKVITEEFGINDALDREATRATRSIITNLNGKDFKWDDNSKVYEKSHTETVTFENKKVKIYVTNYWFEDKKAYQDFRKKSLIPIGYSYEAKMIFLPLFSVGGNSFNDEEAADTIYHEIEHFFQTSKMGHNFGSEQLYAIASSNIGTKDKFERALADVIYISSPSEQDAMVNGMYGSLKNYTVIEIHKKIRESEAAVWCKRLYKDYQLLKKTDDNDLSFALEKYGKTKKWFVRVTAKAIKRFEEKIARTSFKLIKDAQNRDGFRQEPSLKEDYTPGKSYWLTDRFDQILKEEK